VIPQTACNPVVLDLPDALLMTQLLLIISLLYSRTDLTTEFCHLVVGLLCTSKCNAVLFSYAAFVVRFPLIIYLFVRSSLWWSKPVFLKRRAAARYRALASVTPGRERFSWNLSF